MTDTTYGTRRTALVVGASRGIGLGLTERLLERGWHVVATVRSATRTPLHDLAGGGVDGLTIETVDITEADQVRALHERVAHATGLDLLLVNPGTAHDRWETVADVTPATFERVMLTNALGPMQFVERFQDLVRPTGTIAVMSSGQGSVANNTRVTGWEIYRASKAALNQLMRSYAARHPDDPRTLLLTAPGWVRTEMGGADAPLTVEASTRGVIDTIEANAGHGGLQFLDQAGATVAW
ncbi:SDR family NAD(P)-dependent oxidoreductase [uncultured Jatrophihabitans sp.]|uniref:SDR family NAD(P)-dependent oxidoreductase n=1 Tax=uncultured Jatrophihabitans sp. TaxID=1610747 RepID=UPI0035C94DE4